MKTKLKASSKKPQSGKKHGNPKTRRVAHAAAPAKRKRSPAAMTDRLTGGGRAGNQAKKTARSAGRAQMTKLVALAKAQRKAARAAQPKAGTGAGAGARRGPALLSKAAAAAAATAAAGVPARYGQAYYGQAHYVINDPVPEPVPGKATTNLSLSRKSDADLVGFSHNVDDAMTGNARFPLPSPTLVMLEADLGAFETIVTKMENHRLEGKSLTEQRDVLRAKLEQTMSDLGRYVVATSMGDGEWIQSAGMPLKSAPTPTGILPPPDNLRVDPTKLNGQLQLRWNAVTGAKSGYMLEMAEVVDNVAVGWTNIYMGGKRDILKDGLVPGKTYAFRVAAVGGEGGKSAFSPEVWRMAA